tara:strand:- start:179169 stop:179414 length:246 start_codon:yes stop_codon:yes gene_type:complete
MDLTELLEHLTKIHNMYPDARVILTPYNGPDKDGCYRNGVGNIDFDQQPLESFSLHHEMGAGGNKNNDPKPTVELFAGQVQ